MIFLRGLFEPERLHKHIAILMPKKWLHDNPNKKKENIF